jgi:hypothetical protein
LSIRDLNYLLYMRRTARLMQWSYLICDTCRVGKNTQANIPDTTAAAQELNAGYEIRRVLISRSELDALDDIYSDKDTDSVPDDEQSQNLVEDPGPDFC